MAEGQWGMAPLTGDQEESPPLAGGLFIGVPK
jgi:hypothetical protein